MVDVVVVRAIVRVGWCTEDASGGEEGKKSKKIVIK